MSSNLVLTIPACDTCNRETNSAGYFYIQDSMKSALATAGMYEGHPANYFNALSSEKTVEVFEGVLAKILSDPLKYMALLNSEGDFPGYENLVNTMVRFIEKCKKFPNGFIEVTSE